MARLEVTPGGAVVVLQHDVHQYPTPVGGDQVSGQRRRRQLLDGYQQAVVSPLNRIENPLLKVVTVTPLTRQGGLVTPNFSVVESQSESRRQGKVCFHSTNNLSGSAAGAAQQQRDQQQCSANTHQG